MSPDRANAATEERKGTWMQSFSGRKFWPIDPRPGDIFIEDIAHSLSMQCRFGGHCMSFYSVAEHSVLMAQAVSWPNKKWALLHDASEAYVLDIIRPLKPYLENYREIENRMQAAVCERFGLPQVMPLEVKDADNRILLAEREQNMRATGLTWDLAQAAAGPGAAPLGVVLACWAPEEAEQQFLAMWGLVS